MGWRTDTHSRQVRLGDGLPYAASRSQISIGALGPPRGDNDREYSLGRLCHRNAGPLRDTLSIDFTAFIIGSADRASIRIDEQARENHLQAFVLLAFLCLLPRLDKHRKSNQSLPIQIRYKSVAALQQ
jgi:hypothetical protein